MSATRRSNTENIPKSSESVPEVETVNPTTPLMGGKRRVKPALATPETIETDDEREVADEPYPGVDDGFFNNETEVRSEPRNRPMEPNDEKPRNTPVHNQDDDDRAGGHTPRRRSGSIPRFPVESDFAHHNHHHHDMERGSGVLEEIPDINVYQHKKTLAQGMMDLALFSANANQLRYVLDSFSRHPYYYPSLIFIMISLFLQVGIGVLLIWNAIYNVKDEKEVCRANKINNYTVIGIFLVTVVNVFISAFGVADPPGTAVVTVQQANGA